MSPNRHESLGRAERYAQHVYELGLLFRVIVAADLPPSMPEHGMSAVLTWKAAGQRADLVLIAPVEDETTYAVALHELGHCLDPLGRVDFIEGSLRYRTTGHFDTLRDVRLRLEAERAAWAWAHHYAIEWTPLMTQVERYGIGTYEKMARHLGAGNTRGER